MIIAADSAVHGFYVDTVALSARAKGMVMSAQEDPRQADAEAESEDAVEQNVEHQQVVEFHLGEDRCAIDISTVDSIVEMRKVTRVPRTPAAVDGVMDLRGETTAIINPKEFLGIEETTAVDEQNVLVLDRADDKQKIGIRVDEVVEVTSHPVTRIDGSDDLDSLETEGMSSRVARGVIRKPEGDDLDLVVWVDIDAVINELK